MKKAIVFCLITTIICSFMSSPKRTLLESFAIGNFSYCMYKEEKYLHDDNVRAQYFVVYRNNNKNSLCSSFIEAKRNDTIFMRGTYFHTPVKLVFKEFHFHQPQNKMTLDSSEKSFSPNKIGDLILKEAVDYRNGIGTKVK